MKLHAWIHFDRKRFVFPPENIINKQQHTNSVTDALISCLLLKTSKRVKNSA